MARIFVSSILTQCCWLNDRNVVTGFVAGNFGIFVCVCVCVGNVIVVSIRTSFRATDQGCKNDIKKVPCKYRSCSTARPDRSYIRVPRITDRSKWKQSQTMCDYVHSALLIIITLARWDCSENVSSHRAAVSRKLKLVILVKFVGNISET